MVNALKGSADIAVDRDQQTLDKEFMAHKLGPSGGAALEAPPKRLPRPWSKDRLGKHNVFARTRVRQIRSVVESQAERINFTLADTKKCSDIARVVGKHE